VKHRVSLNYFIANGYDEGMGERKARILELLRKLEKLKQDGLLTEEEYRVRREKLIDALLQEEYAYHEGSIKERSSLKSRVFSIPTIILLVCGLLLLGIVGYFFTSSYGGVQTITTVYVHPSYTLYVGTYPTIRTIYSGSVTLEKDCSTKGWSIQANEGDVISVYWESNDYSTYVAIGSDADLKRNRQYYCEVMISFWKTSWPAADHGYSGRLEFRVPSSGTWYVIIANGHWECVFSECPITVTRLEITHTSG